MHKQGSGLLARSSIERKRASSPPLFCVIIPCPEPERAKPF
jgi:hypothetical protein